MIFTDNDTVQGTYLKRKKNKKIVALSFVLTALAVVFCCHSHSQDGTEDPGERVGRYADMVSEFGSQDLFFQVTGKEKVVSPSARERVGLPPGTSYTLLRYRSMEEADKDFAQRPIGTPYLIERGLKASDIYVPGEGVLSVFSAENVAVRGEPFDFRSYRDSSKALTYGTDREVLTERDDRTLGETYRIRSEIQKRAMRRGYIAE